MRTKLAVTLAFLLLLVPLIGCDGTPAATPTPEPTNVYTKDEISAYREELEDSLFFSTVKYINESKDGLNITLETFSITDFGSAVIEGRFACETVIGEIPWELTIHKLDNNDDLQLVYNSGTSSYGFYIDYRSGTGNTVIWSTEDDLFAKFPAARSYKNSLNVDPDDLAIYDSVMNTLNKEWERDEDVVLEELSLKYNITVSDLRRIIDEVSAILYPSSSATPTPTHEPSDELKNYPLRSTSRYLAAAEDGIPEIIFETLGSENKLPGHVYKFTGTVTEKGETSNINYVFVSTENGDLMISDFYNYAKDYNQLMFSMIFEEDSADYSLPEVGETAVFTCAYMGYSQTLEKPSFYMGAIPYLLESELKNYGNEHLIIPAEQVAATPEAMPTATTEPTSELKSYPQGSNSRYLAIAEEGIPEIIFSTTGAENKLPGHVYTFRGLVTYAGSTSGGFKYVLVTTEYGDISVWDMYGFLRNYDAFALSVAVEEAEADFTLPSVGETAIFTCSYGGHSGAVDLPLFNLGALSYAIEDDLIRYGNEHLLIPAE